MPSQVARKPKKRKGDSSVFRVLGFLYLEEEVVLAQVADHPTLNPDSNISRSCWDFPSLFKLINAYTFSNDLVLTMIWAQMITNF